MIRQALMIAAVLLAVILAPAAGAQPPADQTFLLTFVPNVQFSPVYVALEKGYFTEAGFNVTLEHGDEPVNVDLIAAGERQFGLVSGEEVIKARANGRPVVYVYEWFQQYPVGIVAPEGVQSVTDLAGRKVGIPGRFGASYNGLIALLAANGMTESDILLDPISFNAPDVFCVGGVEASVVYINNEPLQIQERINRGACNDIPAITVFPVSAAADLVSNGLVTNEQMIAENPEQVAAMVAAFDKGLRGAINNPAEAYLLSAKYVENLLADPDLEAALTTLSAQQADLLATNPDHEAISASRQAMRDSLAERFEESALLQFDVLLSTINLWDADELGITTPESWEVTRETLMMMGLLDKTIDLDLDAAFTNDFVPGG
ncbi:MAG: hypothetical protein DWB42_01860 [Chloroflexi bacterium]|nr:hypothetical protein [Chloroflexota bacterium]MDL1885697.1 hypothetical protein [Anaerolineae bacterium CFX8]